MNFSLFKILVFNCKKNNLIEFIRIMQATNELSELTHLLNT
jgi:hypothetical protein